MTHLEITLESGLGDLVVDLDVFENRAERGVAAMVGPIGVDHLNLGDGGVAMFLIAEVLLAEGDVSQIHGQSAISDKRSEFVLGKGAKPFDNLHVCGLGIVDLERVGELAARLARLDGVDDVVLDGVDILFGQITAEQVDLGAADGRTLACADQLDALSSAVGALVKLARQVLDRKDLLTLTQWDFIGDIIGLRLTENRRNTLGKQLVAYALNVVAINEAQTHKTLDAKDVAQLDSKLLCLDIKARFLLNVNTRNHLKPTFLERNRHSSWNQKHRCFHDKGWRQLCHARCGSTCTNCAKFGGQTSEGASPCVAATSLRCSAHALRRRPCVAITTCERPSVPCAMATIRECHGVPCATAAIRGGTLYHSNDRQDIACDDKANIPPRK